MPLTEESDLSREIRLTREENQRIRKYEFLDRAALAALPAVIGKAPDHRTEEQISFCAYNLGEAMFKERARRIELLEE